MISRPSLKEIEAAARVLFEAGTYHKWWRPYFETYDQLSAADPISKKELDGIVKRMLLAARDADRA